MAKKKIEKEPEENEIEEDEDELGDLEEGEEIEIDDEEELEEALEELEEGEEEFEPLKYLMEDAKREGRFDDVEKYTKELILKYIDRFNDAQLMAISYDVLKAVYTEEEVYKTFYKEDGTERTNKEILVEMMYAYSVGVTTKKVYRVDKEFFKDLENPK